MKLGTASALLLLGVITIGASVVLQPRPTAEPAGAGQLMFPGLEATLPQVTRLEVTGGAGNGKPRTSTLVLQNGQWGIAERGGYPAQPQKLREVFTGLGELKLLEPRTADPTLFGRLGVDDPAAPNSTATLLRAKTGSGAVLAELLLGHTSQRSQGGLPQSVYARRPAETQSWLAEGRIPVDADPTAWLVREIVDIPRARIAKAEVDRGADHLAFTRKGDAMTLDNPPAGKLDDYHVNEIGSALEGLTLADVKPGALPGTLLGTSVFTTTDGLVMSVTVDRDGKDVWASFAATGTGAAAFDKLKGWAYQLPEWRADTLVPAAATMLSTEPAKDAAPK